MRLRVPTATSASASPGLDLDVEFAAGEEMRTEISAKFRRDGVEAELAAAGLELVRVVDRPRRRLRSLRWPSAPDSARGACYSRAVAGAVPATAAHSSYSRGVVWFAHVVRGLAAIVIIWGHLVVEFQQQNLDRRVHGPDRGSAEQLHARHLPLVHQRALDQPRQRRRRRVLHGQRVRDPVARAPHHGRVRDPAVPALLPDPAGRARPVDPVLYLQTRHTSTTGEVAEHDAVQPVRGQIWIDPSYWTLPIEELFYVFAAVLAVSGLLTKRTAIVGACAVLATLSVVLGRVTFTPTHVGDTPDWMFWTVYWIGRNSAFVIFVFVGVALHHTYRRLWSGRDFVLVTAAIMISGFIALHFGNFPGNQARIYFNSYAMGLGLFVIAYLLGDRIPKSKILDKLADMSYPIYLLNTVCGWILLVFLIEQFDNYYVAVGVDHRGRAPDGVARAQVRGDAVDDPGPVDLRSGSLPDGSAALPDSRASVAPGCGGGGNGDGALRNRRSGRGGARAGDAAPGRARRPAPAGRRGVQRARRARAAPRPPRAPARGRASA